MLSLATGDDLILRATVLRGHRPGRRMYIGASLHGDEVGGIGVIAELVSRLEGENLAGDVVLVPIQNPLAFMQRQRLIPGNAFDTFAVDLAGAFSGAAGGEVGERIALTLLDDFISHCDLAVDIHTALAGGENLDYCFTPAGPGAAVAEARRFARLMRFPLIMEQEQGAYVAPGKLHQSAVARGVPAFCVELLEASRISADITHRCVDGLLNLLRHMEMLEGEALPPDDSQRVASNAFFVRTPQGGVFRPTAELGMELKEGDQLGVLQDVHLMWEMAITTPRAGILYRRAHHRPVHDSERVASVGY